MQCNLYQGNGTNELKSILHKTEFFLFSVCTVCDYVF